MIVVNIVDNLDAINFGIWNAALFTTNCLKQDFNVSSHLWGPKHPEWSASEYSLDDIRFLESTDDSQLNSLLADNNFDPAETVFATHGVWQFCSRWGYRLKQKGFKWVCSPQGMLEPWPLSQKWLKKKIYRSAFENRYLSNSDMIRAVSSPEQANLAKLFPSHQDIRLIPNGVDVIESPDLKQKSGKTILFLGRLHVKKGPANLVKAFTSIPMEQLNGFELKIVGPDQGEQASIEQTLRETGRTNVSLLGPRFGDDKHSELLKADYFVLPTHSEGFPTSLLEAMSYGCFPIISPGCNFPEASSNGLAIDVSIDVPSIREGLIEACQLPQAELAQKQIDAAQFIRDHYTTSVIAATQASAFGELLKK